MRAVGFSTSRESLEIIFSDGLSRCPDCTLYATHALFCMHTAYVGEASLSLSAGCLVKVLLPVMALSLHDIDKAMVIAVGLLDTAFFSPFLFPSPDSTSPLCSFSIVFSSHRSSRLWRNHVSSLFLFNQYPCFSFQNPFVARSFEAIH